MLTNFKKLDESIELSFKSKTGFQRASLMAQWVNVLASKAGNLSLIPRTHKVGRKNQLLQAALLPPHRTVLPLFTLLNPVAINEIYQIYLCHLWGIAWVSQFFTTKNKCCYMV